MSEQTVPTVEPRNPNRQTAERHTWTEGAYAYQAFLGGWKWRHLAASPQSWVYGGGSAHPSDDVKLVSELLRVVAERDRYRALAGKQHAMLHRLVRERGHVGNCKSIHLDSDPPVGLASSCTCGLADATTLLLDPEGTAAAAELEELRANAGRLQAQLAEVCEAIGYDSSAMSAPCNVLAHAIRDTARNGARFAEEAFASNQRIKALEARQREMVRRVREAEPEAIYPDRLESKARGEHLYHHDSATGKYRFRSTRAEGETMEDLLCCAFNSGQQTGFQAAEKALADALEGMLSGEVKNPEGGQKNRPVFRSGLYVASKARHAERWRMLRAAGIPVISSWIDEARSGETRDWTDLWRRCIEEIGRAEAFMLYREEGDVLGGALVEMGVALAVGVPVWWIGPDDGEGAPKNGAVRRAGTVNEVLRALYPAGAEEPEGAPASPGPERGDPRGAPARVGLSPIVIEKHRIDPGSGAEEVSYYACGPTRDSVPEALKDAEAFALASAPLAAGEGGEPPSEIIEVDEQGVVHAPPGAVEALRGSRPAPAPPEPQPAQPGGLPKLRLSGSASEPGWADIAPDVDLGRRLTWPEARAVLAWCEQEPHVRKLTERLRNVRDRDGLSMVETWILKELEAALAAPLRAAEASEGGKP